MRARFPAIPVTATATSGRRRRTATPAAITRYRGVAAGACGRMTELPHNSAIPKTPISNASAASTADSESPPPRRRHQLVTVWILVIDAGWRVRLKSHPLRQKSHPYPPRRDLRAIPHQPWRP